MLEADGISYRYQGDSWLFKGLHVTINPGEIVGLQGPSGAGKTTLAKIMAGYLDPLEGEITVDGELYSKGRSNDTNGSRKAFSGRRNGTNGQRNGIKPEIGKGIHPVQLVWQHPEHAVNPRWRMKKVLEEGGLLCREAPSDAASGYPISTGSQLDHDLLEMLSIHHEWLARRPSELSGGELQRFCLARALGPTTKYLIADEMTTMLDALTQAQIWHAVLKLVTHRRIGVLAISHDRHLLRRISDRIIDFQAFAKPGKSHFK